MTRVPESGLTLAADRAVPRRQRALLAMLALIGGFTDTAGFIILFGLFTAHVTGNIVIAAADVVRHGGTGALAKLLMIPIFIFAIAATTLTIDFVRQRWLHRVLSVMLCVETVLLAAFFAATLVLDPGRSSPDGWRIILVGALGVCAMGVQNTMMRELPLVATLPTTMMTGNTAQMTIAVVRWARACLASDPALRHKSAAQLRVYVPTLAAFVVGSGLAAGGILGLGYWALAIPTGVAGCALVFTVVLDMGPPRRAAPELRPAEARGRGPGG